MWTIEEGSLWAKHSDGRSVELRNPYSVKDAPYVMSNAIPVDSKGVALAAEEAKQAEAEGREFMRTLGPDLLVDADGVHELLPGDVTPTLLTELEVWQKSIEDRLARLEGKI